PRRRGGHRDAPPAAAGVAATEEVLRANHFVRKWDAGHGCQSGLCLFRACEGAGRVAERNEPGRGRALSNSCRAEAAERGYRPPIVSRIKAASNEKAKGRVGEGFLAGARFPTVISFSFPSRAWERGDTRGRGGIAGGQIARPRCCSARDSLAGGG